MMIKLDKKETMINWINDASIEALILKYRYEPIGSSWFIGEVGTHFFNVISASRASRPNDWTEINQTLTRAEQSTIFT